MPVIFEKIKKILNHIYNAPAHGALLRNSMVGWPNSQYELARFYLVEKRDYIEAYAWAEVAHVNNHKDALTLKQAAEEHLKPDEIKLAWDKAREYRTCFCNS